MLLHLHHTFFPRTNSLQSPPIFLITHPKASTFGNELIKKSKNKNNSCVLGAAGSDSEFEIDPEKAREALRKLDEQLQTLSSKQVDPPKIRASDLNLAKEPQMREESIEISGSFLAYTTFVLVVFTLFYNILFLTVIKPAIDGPELSVSSLPEDRVSSPLQKPTPSPEIVSEP